MYKIPIAQIPGGGRRGKKKYIEERVTEREGEAFWAFQKSLGNYFEDNLWRCNTPPAPQPCTWHTHIGIAISIYMQELSSKAKSKKKKKKKNNNK